MLTVSVLHRSGRCCVRMLLRNCDRGCGWQCLQTPPYLAASWMRRQVLKAHIWLSAGHLFGTSSSMLRMDAFGYFVWRRGRHFCVIRGNAEARHCCVLRIATLLQALEEELSIAAGSQRSMGGASFTSADGFSTRSQTSAARQASSNNPAHALGQRSSQ